MEKKESEWDRIIFKNESQKVNYMKKNFFKLTF
jgi:hypothetical protein